MSINMVAGESGIPTSDLLRMRHLIHFRSLLIINYRNVCTCAVHAPGQLQRYKSEALTAKVRFS